MAAMSDDDDQSVTVDFDELDDASLPHFFSLMEDLQAAIERSGVGEFDGNADAMLYAYGPDAEALWAVMEPLVRGFGRPCEVELRLGPMEDDDAPTRVLALP